MLNGRVLGKALKRVVDSQQGIKDEESLEDHRTRIFNDLGQEIVNHIKMYGEVIVVGVTPGGATAVGKIT